VLVNSSFACSAHYSGNDRLLLYSPCPGSPVKMLSTTLFSLVSSLGLAFGATVTHDFEIGWVKANPDGAFERDAIGINGKWPIPTIEVNKGDRLVVKVVNKLGDRSTSLHFHGLFQNGTSHMDGPSQVTQCGIAPGASFTYNFTVRKAKQGIMHDWPSNKQNRLISRAHTGITLTTRASTQTASEAR